MGEGFKSGDGMNTPAALPTAFRVSWHDQSGRYRSVTYNNLRRASHWFKKLRRAGFRAVLLPLS